MKLPWCSGQIVFIAVGSKPNDKNKSWCDGHLSINCQSKATM